MVKELVKENWKWVVPSLLGLIGILGMAMYNGVCRGVEANAEKIEKLGDQQVKIRTQVGKMQFMVEYLFKKEAERNGDRRLLENSGVLSPGGVQPSRSD